MSASGTQTVNDEEQKEELCHQIEEGADKTSYQWLEKASIKDSTDTECIRSLPQSEGPKLQNVQTYPRDYPSQRKRKKDAEEAEPSSWDSVWDHLCLL